MNSLDVAVKLKFLTQGQEKLRLATREAQAFGKSIGQLSGQTSGRFSADMGRAYSQTVKFSGALDRSGRAADRTASALRGIGAGVSGLDRARVAIDRLTVSNTRLARAETIAAAQRRAAWKQGATEAAMVAGVPGAGTVGAGAAIAAGAAVGGVAAGTVGAAAFGLKKAIDFEAAFAEVKKKVELPAGRSWGEIESSINKTARAFGVARGEVAALTAEAGGAGIAFDDLDRFVRLAAKASKGWDMSPREAAENLAYLKTNLNATLPQLEDYADKINKIADTSPAKEKAVQEALRRSAAAGRIADVPYDTTLAVTSALIGGGMPEEVASRFFNAFSAKLRTAASGGLGAKNAAEAFKALGLSVEEVERGMKTDATRTMLDVMQRLNASTDKAAVAVKLFGQEWWDEAARTGQAIDDVIKNLKLLTGTDWKGSLDQNLNVVLQTTQNHLDRMKVLVDQIGDGLMRWSLGPINEQIDGLISKFEQFQGSKNQSVREQLQGTTAGAILDYFSKPKASQSVRPGSLTNYEQRLGLSGGGGGKDIVSLGRQLQGEGFRISEHPAFGGVHPVHKGRGHYEGRAIDVNVGQGVFEAGNPAAGAKFDALASRLRGQGYKVIWRAPGHFDHMHVETPSGHPFVSNMHRRVSPTINGQPPGAAAGGAGPAPGKQSHLGRVQIGTVHIHGVKDLASMERELNARANRRIRAARSNALHDTGSIA